MIKRTLKALMLPLLTGVVAATAGAQTFADYDFAHSTIEFQTIVGTPGAHTDVWGYGQQDDGTRELSMPFAFRLARASSKAEAP